MRFPNRFAALAIVVALAISASAWQAQQEQKPAAPPPPTLKVKVGDTMPDFTLPDHMGNKVTLSGFRGKKNVIVAFYVFAFTGG